MSVARFQPQLSDQITVSSQMRAAEKLFDPAAVTLAVLAGGEGSRMGRPKGELQLFGKPILGWLLDQWRWPGPTLLVTAPTREHPPGWDLFDREVSDPVYGKGPLRGILTALESSTTPIVIITTVDMPGIGQPQLFFLLNQFKRAQGKSGMMFERKADMSTMAEPFPLVIDSIAQSLIESRMSNGFGSVRNLLDEPGFSTVSAPADWSFKIWDNLNRPEDLKSYRQL